MARHTDLSIDCIEVFTKRNYLGYSKIKTELKKKSFYFKRYS